MMVFGFWLSPNHAVIHGMFHVLPHCLSLRQNTHKYSESLAAIIWYKAVILEEV